MSQATTRNKERAREVIEKIVNGGDVDLADEYYREDYIQHNPNVGQGREALKEVIRSMHSLEEPMRVEIKLINAEDDMVWLLLEWSGGSLPEGMPRIQQTAEIFRMEDGMMAEHWDVLQMTKKGA
jgi:predicted SnoaL-like aldol condensation-catalyzing enzyme